MKKVYLKIENDERSFSKFKKEKMKYQKIFLSKLWNFSKKKELDLALDFRDLKDFEKPEFEKLKNVKYIFLNLRNEDFLEYIKKNKKIIFSFLEDGDWEKELRKIFKRGKKTEEKDFQKFLKSIFLEISIEENNEEKIFKKIVFLKKLLYKVLGSEDAEKIKILLKTNFSFEDNLEILENKILKIDGIIS